MADNRLDFSDDEEFLKCKCGFTCGTPTAMQKHAGRCTLNSQSLPSSPVHRKTMESQPSLSRSLTDKLEQTEASPTRSRHGGQSVRPTFHHASSSLDSYKTQLRRQGTDGTIHCKCGFTCGTPTAWEKHQQRCDFSMDLPNQPAAVAATPAPVPSPARAKAKASADSKGLAKAAAPGTRYASAARKPLRLLFIRHGESANRTSSSKCSDPGLSEKGQRQAEALGHHLAETLAPEDIAAGHVRVLCSPMQRCLETIQPALDELALPQSSCFCHGLCYEHGCAGLAFKGTAAEQIVKRFPHFTPAGFTREGLWDYQGASEKESSEECAERAQRVLQVLQESMSDLWQRSSQPTLIVVGHQTLGDLLLHLLLDGHCRDWQYGSPKYRLKNASVSELQVDPDFKAVKKEISSDLHVLGIR
ncbi:Uncharacterized protein SCF082_LOCUS43447 [Durusdinium trenchii]|uniref:Uncharacterized protein n=1 Tax=Durusdinium trenchii TaxID=1381693 RepID=A0ABP0QZE7_9DINO